VAHVLIMPRQGNTVESCIITRWKVAEGATVAADETLCEVETDKASFDVPAGAAGTLLKIVHPEGDDVPVLEAIAVIGAKGEDWKAALGSAAPTAAAPGAPAAAAQPAAPAAPALAAAPPVGGESFATPLARGESFASPLARGESFASPRARKLAAAGGLDASSLAGTGPGGRVIERDVVAALASRPALTAAAKAAVAAGASAPSSGTALGGRAGLGDLSAALNGPGEGLAAAKREALGAFPGKFSETPIKGIRKLIAERMRGSLASTAQLTLNSSAAAKQLQALRARFKASDPKLGLSEVTIGDLVVYAVSRVLPRFPNANATLENGTLRVYERVHLALAVDTPRGLMVPVIRNADLLSLREISAESKRLAAACQAGNINPDELSGGTFTVSNVGAFGIESFTPVINAPQVAILGVDSIMPRAAAGPNGTVVLEQRIGLSITIDHQVLDGAPAARMLKAIADAIADIDLLLMA
jgi:pyruvate dehydrogenase E2 component (dihydrolipoamide acetyltransferase)